MSRETQKTAGQKLTEALEFFATKLKRGDEVEAIRVERHETPDGPMHTRETIVIPARDK